MTLEIKLRPDRISEMSGKIAVIVGYILSESWTERELAALSMMTSDGYVLTDAECFGEADLDRNFLNLLPAADLTADERTERR